MFCQFRYLLRIVVSEVSVIQIAIFLELCNSGSAAHLLAGILCGPGCMRWLQKHWL